MDAQKQGKIAHALQILHEAIQSEFGQCHADDEQVTFIIRGSGVELTDRNSNVMCRDSSNVLAAHKFSQLVDNK